MKLSLSWIFDHIDSNWRDVDVDRLAARFNQVTAEIEDFYRISYDISTFFIGLKQKDSDSVFIPELKKELTLPPRNNTTDLVSENLDECAFLIKEEDGDFFWAVLSDFGVEKEGFLPALDISEEDAAGGWRSYFEADDIILEVDNKSITHRPDMWGHRGFAREIAAFLELPFKTKGDFLSGLPVVSFDKKSEPTNTNSFVIDNQTNGQCRKFNGLFIPSIENRPSNVFIVSRLLKVGSRPINGIVDLTNYVTLDWSQPVHAYDANKITDKKVVIRPAKQGEKMLLLDGNEIELTPQDIVVADGNKPMCLAGVKGGADDSISPQTKAVFFESANFEAGSVRRSALRHKTRTDSSARFEKTLDPNQAIEAILRFVELAGQCGIAMITADEIASVGKDIAPSMLRISHQFIEQRLGQRLDASIIEGLLKRLEFGVEIDRDNDEVAYLISVPSFRASKDVKIKEDILEEIARAYGFEKIKLELPKIHRTPFDMSQLRKTRMIRRYLAYSANMVEQQNYAFFDEQFLKDIDLELPSPVSIVNPVSENNARLVTSLIPGLLKNMVENLVHHDKLSFFETGRTWHEGSKIDERKEVAGVFFEKRKAFDFYEGKRVIASLLSMLGIKNSELSWEKMTTSLRPWYKTHQSAVVYQGDNVLGYIGLVDSTFLSKLPVLPESSAFVFELNGDALLKQPALDKYFAPFSRYQETFFDLSLMTPLALTTKSLEDSLHQVSPVVTSVKLIDFFEKEEWLDKRSLTFRVWIGSKEKTLDKEEIDAVWKQAIAAVEAVGAQIRVQS